MLLLLLGWQTATASGLMMVIWPTGNGRSGHRSRRRDAGGREEAPRAGQRDLGGGVSGVVEALVLRHQSAVLESDRAARLGTETTTVVHELLLELGRAHRVRRRGQIAAGADTRSRQIRRVGHRVGQHLVGRRQRRVVDQSGDQLLRRRRRNRVWNVVRAGTLLQHPVAVFRSAARVLFAVSSGADPEAATVRHAPMVEPVGTGQTAVAGLTRVQILVTAAGGRSRSVAGGWRYGGITDVAVPAKFMRFGGARAAYREQSRLGSFGRKSVLQAVSSLGTGQQVTVTPLVMTSASMPGAGTSKVIPIPIVHDARRRPVTAGLAHRAGTSPMAMSRSRPVMMRQGSAILPLSGIRILFQRLQLRQRNYITVLRPVPDRLLRGHVVVVEPAGVGVEQLPPLGRVRPLDADTLRWIPDALAGRQVGVHVLLGARFDDFDPFHAAFRC